MINIHFSPYKKHNHHMNLMKYCQSPHYDLKTNQTNLNKISKNKILQAKKINIGKIPNKLYNIIKLYSILDKRVII